MPSLLRPKIINYHLKISTRRNYDTREGITVEGYFTTILILFPNDINKIETKQYGTLECVCVYISHVYHLHLIGYLEVRACGMKFRCLSLKVTSWQQQWVKKFLTWGIPSGEYQDFLSHRHPAYHSVMRSCKYRRLKRMSSMQLEAAGIGRVSSVEFLKLKNLPQRDSQILPSISSLWIHRQCSHIVPNGFLIQTLETFLSVLYIN